MRRVRLILLLLLGSMLVPGDVRAQWQLTGDVGMSHLRQQGLLESNVLSLGGTFDAIGAHSFARASGLAARSPGDLWTGQGLIAGAVIDPRPRLLRWELSGAASAFGESNESGTASAEGAARLRVGSLARGVAIGVGGGASAHAGENVPMIRLLGSAYSSLGAEQLSVDAAFTQTGRVVERNVQLRPANSYADAAATWRHDAGGLSIGATAGARAAQRGAVVSDVFGSVDGAMWLSQNSAVVLSVGRALEDVVRGVPRAAYASIAIRFSARPHPSIHTHVAPGPRLGARRAPSGDAVLEIFAPAAAKVEIAGDFTGWAPVALEKAGARWRLARPIAPGPHHVTIRIDGGDWIVPPNLPKVADDFGGSAGVITIP